MKNRGPLLFAILLVSAPAVALGAPSLFAFDYEGTLGPAELWRVDAQTGAASPIGTVGFNRCGAADFDANGVLFAVCDRPTDPSDVHVLVTVNPATGLGSEVGPLNSPTIRGVTDISFRPNDGQLFAIFKSVAGPTGLASINSTTGQATIIGTPDQPPGGLAFAADGRLLGLRGALYSVDPLTANTTVIATPDVVALAMDLDPASALVYVARQPSTLSVLNPSTGTLQDIAPIFPPISAEALVVQPTTVIPTLSWLGVVFAVALLLVSGLWMIRRS
jgi:hypothetical protein